MNTPTPRFTRHRVMAPSLLAITLGLAACAPEPVPVDPVRPVYVTTVRLDTGDTQRRFSGSVAARFESELSFRVAGKVAKRHVDVGQAVRQGQVLAQLDATDDGLAATAAALQWEANRVDAEQAASDAARFRRLLADGSVGAADLERQQARADAAAARAAQARSQLDLARNRVAHTTLAAPFDGVVTAVAFEAGQVAAAGQRVITLAQPGALDVVVDVPESVAPQLRTYEASARTHPDAAPSAAPSDGERAGTTLTVQLRELAPIASAATRTFRARYAIAPSPAAREVRLGSTVELTLRRTGGVASAALPSSALLSTAQSPQVWVVDARTGSLTLQQVQVLSQTTDTVRVAGLADGTRVVSVGAQKLDAAMKVRAVERP